MVCAHVSLPVAAACTLAAPCTIPPAAAAAAPVGLAAAFACSAAQMPLHLTNLVAAPVLSAAMLREAVLWCRHTCPA